MTRFDYRLHPSIESTIKEKSGQKRGARSGQTAKIENRNFCQAEQPNNKNAIIKLYGIISREERKGK